MQNTIKNKKAFVFDFLKASFQSKVVIFSIGLVVLVWLTDPLIDVYLFDLGTFREQIYNPEPHAIYVRTVFSALLILLALVSNYASIKLKKEHHSILEKRNSLQQIIDFSPECIKSVDRNGCLLEMNAAGLEIVEADSSEQVCGRSVYDLIAPEDREGYIEFNERIFSGKAARKEYEVIGLRGTKKLVESHAVPIFDAKGNVTRHLAITRDITQSRRLTEKLNYQAKHDSLTGLINRREFENRLEKLLALDLNAPPLHAVFFIDLDRFKVINDTNGHLAGDEVLVQIAHLMKARIHDCGSVARMGGDEFAVLLTCHSLEDALKTAENIRCDLDASNFYWDGHTFRVSVSIGVVVLDGTYSDILEMVRNADTSCLIAKESGRNRVHLYKNNDAHIVRHHGDTNWVSRIQDGIDRENFILYTQVIEGIGSKVGEKHHEILLRYQADDGELYLPGAFLPAAERFGLASQVDKYVLSKTLETLSKDSRYLESSSSFSINLSGQSIADEQFLAFTLDQFSLNPDLVQKVCFEITETIAISNLNNAKIFIRKLKDLGCQFALDDFGNGLSSFAYLKQFDVNCVKIDGSFVRDIIDDPVSLAMVKSINEIAQLMGKRTIAEFVESDEIKEKLEQLGVDYVQGYGIEKPVPISELLLTPSYP